VLPFNERMTKKKDAKRGCKKKYGGCHSYPFHVLFRSYVESFAFAVAFPDSSSDIYEAQATLKLYRDTENMIASSFWPKSRPVMTCDEIFDKIVVFHVTFMVYTFIWTHVTLFFF
jgi:hypothetical protein